jgi:DNA-binding YbaB/EbfC family protein
MFDALKNLGNMSQLMSRAREMQERMKAMQEQLAARQVTADAGGGMVEATVNGRMEVLRVRFDKTRVSAGDLEMLEDLTAAAIRAAQAKAADMVAREMQQLATEMGLPAGALPGMQ